MKKFLCIVLSFVILMSTSVCAFATYECGGSTVTDFSNSEYFSFGDYTLHYRVFKSDEVQKGQIMLFHGFGLSTVSLESLAKVYAQNGYKVVLVDLPGFGLSSRETTEMELCDREDIVFALMQLLGGKWILGGHSMGGGVAANISVKYPESVSGLVLFAPQTNSKMPDFLAKAVTSAPVRAVFDGLITFAAYSPTVIKALVAYSFSDCDYAKDYDTNKVSYALKIKHTGSSIAVMTSHVNALDYDAFSKLDIPCVIVTSENDRVASQKNLSAIIENAPQCTVLKTVKSGGHMFAEYDSALAAELTLDTINQTTLNTQKQGA